MKNCNSLVQPLKWHGGKTYLAKRIIELMPEHRTFCEPYAGGLAVLLSKNPEGVSEIVNDLNGYLTNFWCVLQSSFTFEKFKRKVEAIPVSQWEWEHAKSEYNIVSPEFPESNITPSEYSVEQAALFFVYVRQSLAGRMKSFASISKSRTRRGMNEQVSAWLTAIEGLPEVHTRLKRVLILNRDGLDVIKEFNNGDTLHYIDTPYLQETRVSKNVYEFEMAAEQHENLLKYITSSDCRSKIMISGYPSALYEKYLGKWKREVFRVPNSSSHKKVKELKEETLWIRA